MNPGVMDEPLMVQKLSRSSIWPVLSARLLRRAGIRPRTIWPKSGSNSSTRVPWCTTPIEAESSLGPDSHHPIISLSGIPSAVMVLRILHPIFASTLCAANPLARIAEPTIAL